MADVIAHSTDSSNSDISIADHANDQYLLSMIAKKEGEISFLNEKLSSIKQYLESFVHAAAHDLQSPVTNLKLLTSLIDKPQDDKDLYFHTVKAAIDKLEGTIKSLVEVVDIQCVEEESQLINIAYNFHKIISPWMGEVRSINGEVHADFTQVHYVNYMESYLNFLIKNLFLNSLIYRANDRDLRISISAKRIAPFFQITFEDNGIGIDMKRYGHNLFKPFTRFSPHKEGKGMGLHLIKTIIEKNGGKIELESQPGKGTIVNCYLREY